MHDVAALHMPAIVFFAVKADLTPADENPTVMGKLPTRTLRDRLLPFLVEDVQIRLVGIVMRCLVGGVMLIHVAHENLSARNHIKILPLLILNSRAPNTGIAASPLSKIRYFMMLQ